MNKHKVILIEYIGGIQVSIVEKGDFFKSYKVEVKNKHEIGFSQTYKYDHQAFKIFNAICSVLKLKNNKTNENPFKLETVRLADMEIIDSSK